MECIKCDRCGKIVPKNYRDFIIFNYCNENTEVHKDLCKDCYKKTIEYIDNTPLKTPPLLLGREDRLLSVLVEIYHDNAADGLTVVDMLNRIIEHELGEGYRIVRK